MKGKTWVIFGCVLVGLSSYRYGAFQAAAVAMTEAGYRGDDPLTVPRGPAPTSQGAGGSFGGGGATDSW